MLNLTLNFPFQFANVANDIIVSSAIRARGIFNNLEAVSASLTDSVMLMNATWPFVTFPNFQVTGMVSNEITGAYTSWIAPLVTHEQRYAFQNYSLRNQWWMDQGHMYDKMVAEDLYVEERYYDEPPYESPFPLQRYNETGIFPFIWTMGERGPAPVPDTDLFFPVSQAAPAEDFMPLANIDLYNLHGSGDYVKGVLALQKPVLTVTTRADYLPLSYDRRFSRSGEALPHTYIYQPIFDTFRKDRKLVGILAVFLPWDQFFMDILPESERGVYVLLKGTCDDQRFTFQLSGRDVEFVGEGDLHESDFSDTEKFFEFAPFSRLEPVEGAKSCAYTVKIYSSEEYSNKFFTNKPYLFAGAVVGCFLLTTLVFVIYDIVVSIRQKKVMESANKTNAIVSQLFPANVRDRMLEELAPEPKKKPASLSSAWMANQHQKFSDSAADSSMSNTMGDMSEFEGSSGGAICPATSEKIFGSKPIADLFPNTTILFADLVGFTAWSSTREPQQVFTLLETIYHGFGKHPMVLMRTRKLLL